MVLFLPLLRMYSTLWMILKRILNNLNLMLAIIAGQVITVTLITSIPLYSEGMSAALLHRQLEEPEERAQPKSSIMLRWLAPDPPLRLPVQAAGGGGGLAGPGAPTPLPTPPVVPDDPVGPSPELFRETDAFLENSSESMLGIPRQLYVSYAQTDVLPILLRLDEESLQGRDFAGFGHIGFVENVREHAVIIDGRFPEVPKTPEGAVEAMMTTKGMDELGIDVGETIVYVFERNRERIPINVKIVGRWWPTDAEEIYWFYQLDYFNSVALLPKEAYIQHIMGDYVDATEELTWFQHFDVDAIRSDNVGTILGGLVNMRTRMTNLLGDVRMEFSPEEILLDFQRSLFFLKILLFVLAAPIVGIVLYYIVISASMIVDRQRNEIAIIKSRGGSNLQVLGIYLSEGGLLGIMAVVGGPLLGTVLAQFIGRTYTFLVFADRELLPIHLTTQTYQFAALAVALSILAMLLPAISAARFSIVTYKQDIARTSRRVFWQRFLFDFVIAGAAGYGYYLLRERRSIVTLGEEGGVFSDPLLLLVPALFVFASALIFLRILPLFIEILARVGGRFWGVSILLGLRQIGRMPGQYTRLVLLLILTLSLGTYSASVAQTLDRNFNDRVYYTNGSDLFLSESGRFDDISEEWNFIPVEEHKDVAGVKDATRVFEEEGRVQITGQARRFRDVVVLGIDTSDFARVSWWRDDFAPENFVALLNRLGADDRGVIIDSEMFWDFQLKLGDPMRLQVKGRQVELNLVGVTYYWPRLWPDTDNFVIVNLDYLFDKIGRLPYDVWAQTEPGIHPQVIVNDLSDAGFLVHRFFDARELTVRLRDDPGRTGIFGILTAGFLIAGLLTVVGFMLYSYLSFQRRFQQIGILRAIGLSIGQLINLFVFEQGFLIAIGVLSGTTLGVVTGKIFIPFLQLKVDKHGGIPEFITMTAWDDIGKIYILFGVVLAVAVPAFIWMLTRLKIHEAIKFGEETG
ncbi:MAG: hypothetical protein CL878_07000 [Dehalococcoidia bacterium]|nr:hypothetical protein [Dehalococcoidia bacterium]